MRPWSPQASPLLNDAAGNAFQLGEESDGVRDAYGRNTFGQSCLLARRLVESGVRLITVNMFETVFNKVTWDCHGTAPFSTLDDYSGHLLPTLDRALSALLDDLRARGLLDSTMVVATGEFGRTPRLNAAGGRDHWPGVWTALCWPEEESAEVKWWVPAITMPRPPQTGRFRPRNCSRPCTTAWESRPINICRPPRASRSHWWKTQSRSRSFFLEDARADCRALLLVTHLLKLSYREA